jgi:glycine cleavage system H protein
MDGDVGTIGITDFAQEALGEVVFVELPEVGTAYEKGDTFGSVESVKAASSVYMPTDGEVLEVNERLNDESELVNQSPTEDGWICKVKVTDVSQLDGLLDQAAYEKHCEEEGH